ncbi:MAG: DNA translocase FtsK 4TM domain-containing protein [Deferribacteraceae bacterium]|jgi:S-DNA-T family DNA segregation ATPase FtsK/SpoIIIE|nr:DNA translocase FtsK 4TM domain-containing protein [Deferribacteraceae bacterium]
MRKGFVYEIFFVVLIVAMIFTTLSLLSYSAADPSYSNIIFSRYQEGVDNIFGKVGAYSADILGTIFGWCALFAPLMILFAFAQTVRLYRGRERGGRVLLSVTLFFLFILMFSILSGLIGGEDLYFADKSSGGIFGVAGSTIIASVIGSTGGIILSIIAILLLLLGIAKVSAVDLVRYIALKIDEARSGDEPEYGMFDEPKPSFVRRVRSAISDLKSSRTAKRKKALEEFVQREKTEQILRESEQIKHTPVVAKIPPVIEPPIIEEVATWDPESTPPPLIVPSYKPVVAATSPNLEMSLKDILPEGAELLTVTKLEELLATQESREPNIPIATLEPEELEALNIIPAYEPEAVPAQVQRKTPIKDYSLSITLLDPPSDDIVEADPQELRDKADLLLNKLRDFGVDGRIREIRPGPVVTLFELEPAPGIKINKIANLENDLALAMSALSIRIIAPIPGKAAVGIEVPNAKRNMVSMRELLEVNEFGGSESPLTVALGKDISGKPYFTDLRKMPHLLVAGTTGSGKSVCINTIICSVLYKSSPSMVKFVMVDPKMVELSVYEGIPHLAAPVVTDSRKASAVLQNVVKEMEARYTLLAACKVRNIDSYNEYIKTHETLADGTILNPMPYMVVIVDEFGDLMMVAGKEVENAIIRIAQMARAVGIHLILATQRPSVNVITGIIKANMPARISFRVSSKIDSRTILDQNGAELLLGKGDSLFIPPGSSDALRIHGCFVSEAEVLRIVEGLKIYGEPEYDMALMEESGGEDSFDDEDLDARYDEALKIVKDKGFASISMIQRYLRIGYNRAARIVETMEQQGLIAPSDGTSKPRELLRRD